MTHIRLISVLSVGLLTLGTAASASAAAFPLSSDFPLPAEVSGSSGSPGSSGPSLPGLSSHEAEPIDYPGYPGIVPDTTQRLEVPVPGYGTRDVVISLPEDYDPAQSYPVWLAYPGRFISPEHMSTDTGLQVASDAIVAYARGESGAFAGAPYSTTTMEEDIAYTRAIIDRIEQDHLVDRERIFAIGHSNGGGFALSLACFAPDLVAGVSAASGIYYDPGTPKTGQCAGDPVPVMIEHSSNDGLSWIDGGTAHGAHYMGARQLSESWAEINGCSARTVTRPVAHEVTAHVYQDCVAPTEFVVSENDGHGWPHYASFQAWDFFSRLAS